MRRARPYVAGLLLADGMYRTGSFVPAATRRLFRVAQFGLIPRAVTTIGTRMKPQGHQGGKDDRLDDWPGTLSRRRFFAVGSGYAIGCLCGARLAAAAETQTIDIGALNGFSEDGISEEFIKQGFFVIRHEGRLFAASATCPHKGNELRRDAADPGQIVCEGHGSTFDAAGNVAIGPATTGLVRLGIAVNDKGHVIVEPGKEFPQDDWSDKSSYLEIK